MSYPYAKKWEHHINIGIKSSDKKGYEITGDTINKKTVIGFSWDITTNLEFEIKIVKRGLKSKKYEKSLRKYIKETKEIDRVKHLVSDEPFYK